MQPDLSVWQMWFYAMFLYVISHAELRKTKDVRFEGVVSGTGI